jgi:hypothetical protein
MKWLAVLAVWTVALAMAIGTVAAVLLMVLFTVGCLAIMNLDLRLQRLENPDE